MNRSSGIVFPAAFLLTCSLCSACVPGSKEAKEFLATMPAHRITEIRMEPVDHRPLVKKTIMIRDRKTIEAIADALRSAAAFSPNRPDTGWAVLLRIRAEKDYGGRVVSTQNGTQGVYIRYSSNIMDGFHYGTYRNDRLGPLLESIAEAAKENAHP